MPTYISKLVLKDCFSSLNGILFIALILSAIVIFELILLPFYLYWFNIITVYYSFAKGFEVSNYAFSILLIFS